MTTIPRGFFSQCDRLRHTRGQIHEDRRMLDDSDRNGLGHLGNKHFSRLLEYLFRKRNQNRTDPQQPLFRFALSLSRNEATACDLTQQAFYIWAAKGHQLRDLSKVKTWLFTTLYREFLAATRHDAHFIDLEEDTVVMDAPQMEASMANALDGAIIQDALHQLHVRYRGPVSLFYLQQHSYREIAEILEIPIGTVMSRIARGKAELRKALSYPPSAEAKNALSMTRGTRNG